MYYAHGKLFDDKEEFWKFIQEWPDMPVDIEEFKHQMDLRIKELEMNNQVRGKRLTNRQAYRILRLCTDWAESDTHKGN